MTVEEFLLSSPNIINNIIYFKIIFSMLWLSDVLFKFSFSLLDYEFIDQNRKQFKTEPHVSQVE